MSHLKNFQEEFSREDIRIARDVLETNDYSILSRICLNAPTQIHRCHSTFLLGSEHQPVRSKTLKFEYALQVWIKAIFSMGEMRRSWNMVSVKDSPFGVMKYWNRNTQEEQFLLQKFWLRLEQIADSGEISVCEGFSFGSTGSGDIYKIVCDVVIDSPTAFNTYGWDMYKYPYNKELVSYKWNEIKSFFCELTLNQMRLCNYKQLHTPKIWDELLLSACESWDIETIEYAIKHGANINCLSKYGDSPLAEAVQFFLDETDESRESRISQCKQIIDLLLSYGADINLYGVDGSTPLLNAYHEGCPEIVEYLLDRGADPNVNCFLMDDDLDVSSSILDSIYGNPDGSTDTDREIEKMILAAGGKYLLE